MTKDEALEFTRHEFDRHEIVALADGYKSMPETYARLSGIKVMSHTERSVEGDTFGLEYDFESNKEAIVEIFESAKNSYFKNIEARYFSADLIQSGVEMPEYVKQLVCALLLNTVLPKRKRGRSPIPKAFTERRIMMTIFKLKDKGYMPVTRNDVSEPRSACDVVSEVLSEYGAVYTYDSVRKIWDKSSPYRE